MQNSNLHIMQKSNNAFWFRITENWSQMSRMHQQQKRFKITTLIERIHTFHINTVHSRFISLLLTHLISLLSSQFKTNMNIIIHIKATSLVLNSVTSPFRKWRHRCGNGITAAEMASPLRKWHHRCGNGITAAEMASPLRKWHHRCGNGITAAEMASPLRKWHHRCGNDVTASGTSSWRWPSTRTWHTPV